MDKIEATQFGSAEIGVLSALTRRDHEATQKALL